MASFRGFGNSVGSKTGLKRTFPLIGGVWSILIAFIGGVLASYVISRGNDLYLSSHGAQLPSRPKVLTDAQKFHEREPTARVEHSDKSATGGFINAWRQDRETCNQWMSMQATSNSYLDAYIVGAQKGATSTISRRLFTLGVRPVEMKKEWHYFNSLEEGGSLPNSISTHKAFTLQDLKKLRYDHYKTGFPDDINATVDRLPGIDNRKLSERLLNYDGTVEYFHSGNAAFMAHALTPHAKIVVTVRNPIDRAISQFNMVIRTRNKKKRKMGEEGRPATPAWFHEVVTKEIEKIVRCGYDEKAATIDRPTSKMLSCMLAEGRIGYTSLLPVTRGLYHVHLGTWRNYFRDHRILVLSFPELIAGLREPYEDLTNFLCIRPFPEDLLKSFGDEGSTLSEGQQIANGMEIKRRYLYEGKNDAYMLDIKPETRKVLNDFYRPANRKLEALLGRKIYDYE